ncbi:hypothetical protein C8R47DRAFT_1207051 [Mycena vitilis]|nr:hypothetical protein C8R47DRAFT_1207051 [Mycena vitilis]
MASERKVQGENIPWPQLMNYLAYSRDLARTPSPAPRRRRAQRPEPQPFPCPSPLRGRSPERHTALNVGRYRSHTPSSPPPKSRAFGTNSESPTPLPRRTTRESPRPSSPPPKPKPARESPPPSAPPPKRRATRESPRPSSPPPKRRATRKSPRPSSPPLKRRATRKSARPSSPPPEHQRRVRIIAWLGDNVHVLQQDVPITDGQIRLSDHKITLGMSGLECGVALQKYSREYGMGIWRDIGWETSVALGAATQLVVRCKGLKSLKNWELHEPYLDI